MKNSDRNVQLSDLLDAIQDQSRIMIALREEFANKTEAAKRLTDLGMPASRVASLLGKPLSHITSALAKARRKSNATTNEARTGANAEEPGGEIDETR